MPNRLGEVAEGLVRLGHAVDLFTLGDGLALAAGGVEELVGQALSDGLALFAAGGRDDPAEAERLLTLAVDLHGDLVVGTADALGADFDEGLDLVDGHMEAVEGALGGVGIVDLVEAALDDVHGVVDVALGDGLLAVVHDAVGELREDLVAVDGVGTKLLGALGETLAAHLEASWLVRRLLPAFVHPASGCAGLLATDEMKQEPRGSCEMNLITCPS